MPIGGLGQRFKDAGYKDLKPLIKIGSKTMLELSVESLLPTRYQYHLIFIYTKNYDELLRPLANQYNAKVVFEEIRKGMTPACLYAKDLIDNDDPVIIAACDQVIDWNIDDFIDSALQTDGMLLTHYNTNPAHSYSKVENNRVVEVAEKKVISDNSNVGIYFFRKGKDFIKSAIDMVLKEEKTNGQYYIAPIYNEMLDKNIQIYNIDKDKVHIIGTPEELNDYTKTITKISR